MLPMSAPGGVVGVVGLNGPKLYGFIENIGGTIVSHQAPQFSSYSAPKSHQGKLAGRSKLRASIVIPTRSTQTEESGVLALLGRGLVRASRLTDSSMSASHCSSDLALSSTSSSSDLLKRVKARDPEDSAA